jgi:uncharacterized protein (DUF427 family)
MKSNKGPAPGSIDYPDHVVRITASEQRWKAYLGDLLLADSDRTQVLKETGFEPVVYFPAADVSMNQLIASDDRSNCPFKGEARYFTSTVANDRRAVAWTYPAVFDEVATIKGHIAFHKDRVELRQTQ